MKEKIKNKQKSKLAYSNYIVKDLSYFDFKIKKLEIFGNYEIEKNKVLKITTDTIKKFLKIDKDIDFLIVYYYPTDKNMENHEALCSLFLNKEFFEDNLIDLKILKKIQWYGNL